MQCIQSYTVHKLQIADDGISCEPDSGIAMLRGITWNLCNYQIFLIRSGKCWMIIIIIKRSLSVVAPHAATSLSYASASTLRSTINYELGSRSIDICAAECLHTKDTKSHTHTQKSKHTIPQISIPRCVLLFRSFCANKAPFWHRIIHRHASVYLLIETEC